MRRVPRRLMLLAATALLATCGCPTDYPGPDDDSADDDDSAASDDADGDGYPAGEDCDDTDASLNYDDADGDGVSSCDGDCDDADPLTFPGAIELCDGLDNDCSGFAELDGDGVCGIWSIGVLDDAWTAQAMNPAGSANGPTEAIQAAFGLADTQQVYALTATSYHVLEVLPMLWSASGPRDDLFPEASGVTLRAAGTQPASWTGGDTASVFLMADDAFHGYSYSVSGGTFTYTGAADYDASWDGQLAPSPSSVVASWIDMDNAAGWMTDGNPAQSCGAESPVIGTYIPFLTSSGRVHFYDAQYCAEFFSFADTADWSVFAVEGAPLSTVAKGAAWTGDRLFVFGPP